MPRPTRPIPSRLSGEGPAFVYIAPCVGEDILKLGFSRDPLQRLQSLHPRFHEFFDLDAGWLVQTDSVREARDLELALRAPLRSLNAPSPLLVVRAAAGHTEWFRGALPALAAATDALAVLGHEVHRPMRGWLQRRLEQRGDALFQWSEQMLQAIEHAGHVGNHDDRRRLQRQLRDTLDAWPALGLPLDQRVPASVLDWHRSDRDR